MNLALDKHTKKMDAQPLKNKNQAEKIKRWSLPPNLLLDHLLCEGIHEGTIVAEIVTHTGLGEVNITFPLVEEMLKIKIYRELGHLFISYDRTD